MLLDEAFNCLKRGYDEGCLSQAYLLVGPPRGVAMDLAVRVLSLLFCEEDEKPCLTCQGCRGVVAHTTPDILWVEPQKKSRIISKDQLAGIRERMSQTSFSGGWKVTVLVAADRLGPQAANAFLKTLEEPPPRSLFLLLTDAPQALLPTVISRCQRITLTAPEEEALAHENLDEVIEILSAGPMRGATARFSRADRMVKLMKGIKKTIAGEIARELEADGIELDDETEDARVTALFRERRLRIMQSLLLWYRDILIHVCDGDPSTLHFQEHAVPLRQSAANVTYGRAMENIRIIEHMNKQFDMNLQDGIVFTNGFSRLS